MAKLIKTDGMASVIHPKNHTDFSLKELQSYVDGYIDVINLGNGEIIVINDDGKGRFPMNLSATILAYTHDAIFRGDYICGDVVVCKNEEVL